MDDNFQDVFSSSVSYFANKMAEYTTNNFRLSPQGKQTGVQAGDICTFILPSNSLVNLDSFEVHFNAGCTGVNTRLPAINHLIQQVDVFIGGSQVGASHPYYNALCAMVDAVSYKRGNSVAGHPEIIRAQSESGVAPIEAPDPEGFVGANALSGSMFNTDSQAPYSITKWMGFLGTVQPRIIDTSLLGTIEVRLTFAPNSVLTSSVNTTAPVDALILAAGATRVASNFTSPLASAGTGSYEVKNLSATVDCCSFPGGVYDQLLARELSSSGLHLPFKNYFAQNQSHAGSSSFSVSTQSLDRVWVGFRSTANLTITTTVPEYKSYLTQNSPIVVPGYLGGAAVSRHSSTQEKYTSAPFCFCNLGVNNTISLNINNAQMPQYQLPFAQLPAYTACNLPGDSYLPSDMTMAEYNGVANIFCTRLNVPGSEYRREISGLDTRSSSILMKCNTVGQLYPGASFDSLVFMECTSTLVVQPGRQSAVIQ
jgi:hypothetical protein